MNEYPDHKQKNDFSNHFWMSTNAVYKEIYNNVIKLCVIVWAQRRAFIISFGDYEIIHSCRKFAVMQH